jgi:succinyl-diaminopimelate desuccinylase
MVERPTAQDLGTRALELCRIASPIGQEKQLADWVENWARGHFPEGQIVRLSHSLALGDLADPRPTVALVGHLDTVPASAAEPNPARIEGDRLFGLGSSDMKGGLAVMLALAERRKSEPAPLNLVLVLYEREEGPYLESGLGPLLEKLPALKRTRFAIALEPTGNLVQVGCVGSLHATLRFAGKSAHSARPWQGENAIHRAGPFLTELLALAPREVRIAGYPFFEVFSVTQAFGGKARNVIPSAFELNLNYRFAPGKSVEAAQDDVRALVAGRAEIAFTDLAPSGRVCADNPLLQRLLSLTAAPAESKQAWTDVARLAAFGMDAINFGPGEPAQAHQANESASVSKIFECYQLLSQFIAGPSH